MKITFQNVSDNQNSIQTQSTQKQQVNTSSQPARAIGAQAVSYSKGKDNSIFDHTKREKSGSFSDIQKEAAAVDAGLQQDFMTVMSHTMSAEDYAKLEKDGFHFEDFDPKEAVTIVDKIKTELIKSGQNIVGYTDDIDLETLKNAVGSDSLANALKENMASSDFSLTPDLCKEIAGAFEMAESLTTPNDGTYRYMLDNGLEGEIQDFYMARSSGATGASPKAPKYYAEEVGGYLTQNGVFEQQKADHIQAGEAFEKQIEHVIEQAGQEPDEKAKEQANWLLNQNLPLTAETLVQYQKLLSVQFPVTEDTFAKAVVDAVQNGKSPYEANLVKSEKLYEKAIAMLDRYKSSEEIRLHMTAEVNVKLLKSGFSLDTATIEETLKAVEQAEREIAQQYFPEDSEAVTKYQLYNETNDLFERLPKAPAAVLGLDGILTKSPTEALRQGEEWISRQAANAVDRYETLMTAPRADLGDHIKKAFTNVDEILSDLAYETTEENRRAVRILGYNRMEINAENIERVIDADRRVSDVIEKMTPASVLKMIRDDINPLERSFTELNEYFDSLPDSFMDQSKEYSRFLFGLEQNHQLTEEEREGFIGIHRLLRQIEKSDGAAIGNLVNTHAELDFRNLLSAVRSGKVKNFDVKADDATGFLKEAVDGRNSISEQIQKAFADDRYYEKELSLMRQEFHPSGLETDLLERIEEPVNMGNILAAQTLLGDSEVPLKEKKYDDLRKQTFEKAIEHMDEKDTFTKEIQDSFTAVKQAIEDGQLLEAESFLDVRSMRMAHKQLTIASSLAKSEEYIIPMELGDQVAKVHLTLKQGTEEKGNIDLTISLENKESVSAHLELENDKISGFLSGFGESGVINLKKTVDIFVERIKEDDTYRMDAELAIVNAGNKNTVSRSRRESALAASDKEYSNRELYKVAKIFLQAVKETGMES